MNNQFELTITMTEWIISNNNCLVCRPVTHVGAINAVIENGAALKITPDINNPLTYNGDGFTITDKFTAIEDGFYKVERKYKNITSKPRSVVLMFECEAMFTPSFYMIPSVTYNGNRWGTGNEPKGLSRGGQPWVFAYNRVSIPSATFSEDESTSVGLFACDGDQNSLVSSCSMSKTAEGMIHRLIWPDREEPLVYISRDEYAPAATPEITIQGNEEFTVSFYLSLCPVQKPFFGWTKTFDRAHKLMKRDINVPMSAKQFWQHRVNYIKAVQFTKSEMSGGYPLLDMGLLPNGDIYNYFPDESGTDGVTFQTRKTGESGGERHFEIGWCGQNASLAVALIYDYLEIKDTTSLEMATAVLDTWADHAQLPCGLFEVVFDEVLRKETEHRYFIDTCNLGWGIWQMLEAYQVLKTIGVDKPSYRAMALNACDFFLKNRAPDGSFGKTWGRDGTPLDTGGTIGCFILPGLTKAYEVTGNSAYLTCACDMYRFYVERDLYRMECTAGALDTHCIDKETGWPLLKSGLDLYELTGDNRFLEDATLAAYYIASFMFQYDALYGEDTDFAIHGYRTYGGTSVSTQHHHLDPWGSLLAYDFYRLYKITGDDKWYTWFDALWKNAMLCVSDGTQIVHGLKRPASAQNEIFLQCRFTFAADCPPGRLNDWLQSWAGAFKLITMYRAKQDNQEVV